MKEMDAELEAIAAMLKIARNSGLEVEVVAEFAKFVASGDDVQSAATAALWEWDCA